MAIDDGDDSENLISTYNNKDTTPSLRQLEKKNKPKKKKKKGKGCMPHGEYCCYKIRGYCKNWEASDAMDTATDEAVDEIVDQA